MIAQITAPLCHVHCLGNLMPPVLGYPVKRSRRLRSVLCVKLNDGRLLLTGQIAYLRESYIRPTHPPGFSLWLDIPLENLAGCTRRQQGPYDEPPVLSYDTSVI